MSKDIALNDYPLKQTKFQNLQPDGKLPIIKEVNGTLFLDGTAFLWPFLKIHRCDWKYFCGSVS